MKNMKLTHDIIASKVSKIKVNKAPGVDGIVLRILIKNADLLSLP